MIFNKIIDHILPTNYFTR